MTLLQRPRVVTFAILGLAGAAFATAALATANQGQVREFTVTGRDHAFAPGRIEVQKDDLIKITFTASDIAHSFTVDSYRIAKRAGAGQTVVFEFRADQAGTFPFYCNLKQDERCRQMKGDLVVR
jgi:heme/copper-type cytochrome/quinol oxidase subunit 2